MYRKKIEESISPLLPVRLSYELSPNIAIGSGLAESAMRLRRSSPGGLLVARSLQDFAIPGVDL
jgi:hypothetical protein